MWRHIPISMVEILLSILPEADFESFLILDTDTVISLQIGHKHCLLSSPVSWFEFLFLLLGSPLADAKQLLLVFLGSTNEHTQ